VKWPWFGFRPAREFHDKKNLRSERSAPISENQVKTRFELGFLRQAPLPLIKKTLSPVQAFRAPAG
jgi:hypothetical protein